MPATATFPAFAAHADYSLLQALNRDPQATGDGHDHRAREVLSGHYVPVTPTPLPEPAYVAHSSSLFRELGLSDDLAHDASFQRWFSGDASAATGAMPAYGWATGYALSIYGTEYIRQCCQHIDLAAVPVAPPRSACGLGRAKPRSRVF